VRIAYFDEAGLGKPDEEPYLVVASLLVHGDTQSFEIDNSVDRLINLLIPENLRDGFEFHAKDLFSGHKKCAILPKAQRWDLLKNFLSIVGVLNLPISYGAEEVRQGPAQSGDPRRNGRARS
jgi:hypothetical protein